MEKSKIGISIHLFAAILFFLGAAGGALTVVVAAVYIWAFEENIDLKKMAVKALMLDLRDGGLYANWALFRLSQSGMTAIDSIIRIVVILVYITFGLRVYRQREIKIRLIDNILDKHFS